MTTMRLRTILLASFLALIGSATMVLAQQEPRPRTWFMETGKTSRGGYRLPVMSGGLTTTTSALIRMKVESYPETVVKLGRPSPFDLVLKRANLRADMLFDLTVVDLVNFPVSTRLR